MCKAHSCTCGGCLRHLHCTPQCASLAERFFILGKHFPNFKNASAFLLRDARHAMHDILLLRISAILPEAISDGGLTPTTDTDLLLATYRGGSHLTSDIHFRVCSMTIYSIILTTIAPAVSTASTRHNMRSEIFIFPSLR